VAAPNPFHTGVKGLNECVRSTNCFDAIIWYASASDPDSANAIAGALMMKAALNRIEMTNRARFLSMRSFLLDG
jgi:hypothetical protein